MQPLPSALEGAIRPRVEGSMRLSRVHLGVLTAAAAWTILFFNGTILGRTPQVAPQSDVVTGSGNFSPIVADLEKSIEFYHDVLGLDVPGTAASRAFGA